MKIRHKLNYGMQQYLLKICAILRIVIFCSFALHCLLNIVEQILMTL